MNFKRKLKIIIYNVFELLRFNILDIGTVLIKVFKK